MNQQRQPDFILHDLRLGYTQAACLAAVIIFSCNALVAESAFGAEINFDRDVGPLLTENCAKCHGGVKKEAGFSVNSRELLLKPTEYYGEPVVVPGNAAASEMIRRITAEDDGERMPPEQPLSADEIEILKRWVDGGAEWPTHWAYAAPVVQQPSLPTRCNTEQNPIDGFIQQRLDAEGIQPSPPADMRTLYRRLSLDLTGLLPTPQQVAGLVNDDSSRAYATLVDRLLNQPQFGERWARHWLDEARYADSEGYEKDSVKADAFRYRDWVIRAINDDMPFDQFTIKQIAGDLLPEPTHDDLIATKFHLQAQFNLEGGVDSEEDRTKRVIDRVNTVSTVWLGMTIGCTQCHDHPYDPLRNQDFYAMYAFFNNADFAADFLIDVPTKADELRSDRQKTYGELFATLERQVNNKNLSVKTQSGLSRLRGYDNSKGFTRFLRERTDDRRPTYVFHRGDFLQPRIEEGEVAPAPPALLPPLRPRGEAPDRLDLGHWLVDGHNPLTARVTVNKVWAHLFGRPLADQPQDFGSRGSAPTHPELLDWLANWFVHEAGWSRKQLIRLIVSSQTYRQSSAGRPELKDVDPDNRLLSRQNATRVEAEIIRDISLQTAGLLSGRIGGPSVFPPLPDIVAQQTYAGSNKYKRSEGEQRYRRGMYTFFRRTAIDPNLATFDCPDSSFSAPARDQSNNPLQALVTLQNEVFHEAAQGFAVRLLSGAKDLEPKDRLLLRDAFQIALGRNASSTEFDPLLEVLHEARKFYRTHPEQAELLVGTHQAPDVDLVENAAWVATARVMLNLSEFLTRN